MNLLKMLQSGSAKLAGWTMRSEKKNGQPAVRLTQAEAGNERSRMVRAGRLAGWLNIQLPREIKARREGAEVLVMKRGKPRQ